jgi:hypothetical protein
VDEMNGACSSHWRDKKYIQIFNQETSRKEGSKVIEV